MIGLHFQELISLLVVSVSLMLLYFKWSYKHWERKNIPYLEPTIPYGNVENPFNVRIGVAPRITDLYREFRRRGCKRGGIFSVTRPIYMPIDLDNVKDVMVKDFQHFVDRGLYHHEKADPLSSQLFTIEGQKWRNLRVKITPVFTSGKMKAMFDTILECGDQMKEALEKTYLATRTFDIRDICACFTTDVIGSCAFGIDCNSFKNPDSEFRKHGKKVFGTNVDRMIRNFLALSFPNICKKMGMRVFPLDTTTFFSDVIKDVIRNREDNTVKRNDFIKLLLDIKNSDETLTLHEMTAQAFVFFLAGFETSSSTMGFCFYQLARNQDVQEKVRQEIHSITAKYAGKISYDSMQEMTYMTQVIEETLRMYPVVPVLNRVCTKDYVLPDTDTIIESGTKVLIPIYGIHHDSEYYPNPEIFDPDRFSVEQKADRNSFAFLPFGEGPRNCIGLRFGMMQVKIGLIILLRQYRFSLNSKTPPQSINFNPKCLLLSSIEDILLDVSEI